MSLVNYDDSSGDEGTALPERVPVRMPPTYLAREPAVDSRGKTRSFRVPDGCVSCALFLETPVTATLTRLCETALTALLCGRPCYRVGAAPPELPPHLSLSRCFVVAGHQVARLVQCVHDSFARSRAFDVSLGGATFFGNDDGTRSFLSLTVGVGGADVESLIQSADAVMVEFGKPTYYEVREPTPPTLTPPTHNVLMLRPAQQPPIPHVSMLWTPGRVSPADVVAGLARVRDGSAGDSARSGGDGSSDTGDGRVAAPLADAPEPGVSSCGTKRRRAEGVHAAAGGCEPGAASTSRSPPLGASAESPGQAVHVSADQLRALGGMSRAPPAADACGESCGSDLLQWRVEAVCLRVGLKRFSFALG